MKECTTCKIEKDIREFSKRTSSSDGLYGQCKNCKKISQDKWYVKNKERHISNVGKNNKAKKLENVKNIISYLKEHPCVDCGESNPVVLEFDHVRGDKKYEISMSISHYYHSWESVMKEIEKCEVRCSNCHRIVTAKRGGWLKYILCLDGV